MRKIIAIAGTATAALLLAATASSADPAFGPGNGQQVGNQKCHPPGQTGEVPGCK